MKKILIVFMLVFAVGCAKKYVKAPEQPAEREGAVKEEMMETEVKEEVVEEISIAEEEKISEQELSIEEKAKSIFRDVLFDYDKYDIKPEARPILDEVSSFLNENTVLNIIIEGHCDERGTNEYNLALGEKRSEAAKNYLVSLGVSTTRIITVTYGEEKPVCIEQDESCWQQNRRAHFVVAK